MPFETENSLAQLADELYEQSEDDDIQLAQLMRQLPEQTAVKLCTSNLTNALQAYIYAFDSVPDAETYDRLLLEPSSSLLYGIKLKNIELAAIVFGFDRRSEHFFIGVYDGEKIAAAFGGKDAFARAEAYAREHYCD